jgi:pyruvate/2-oxoglutarate dehydrogenase complex dihydrolipoamide dehydrogenase (E3) component
MNEARAKEAGIACSVWSEDFRMNDRSLAEGSAQGKIKLILDEKEKPLGVQILGLHAGDLISEWVVVMNSGMRLSSLAGAVYPYPTIAEINKKVAGNYISGKLFSGKVKKALKLFFSLRGRACE